MSPCVAGDEEALDLDIADVEGVAVLQKLLGVVDRHLRKPVEMVDHLPAHLAGQVAVLDLAHIQLRVPEQSRAVGLHRADVVGVLMGDEDVADGLGDDAQLAHFFFQLVIVVSRVDHDGGIALAVEEDICRPFPDTGDVFVDPAGVQWLEDLLAPVHFILFSD